MPLITSCRFEFHSVKVARTQTEGSFYQEPFWCRGSVHKDLFFFSLAVKHVGQEQMFMHPKYASNYASVIVGRTQSLHCRARGWQDTKAMPLTVSLSASVSPSLTQFWHDNTSIQLSGLIMFHACAPALTAVLSHFTPFDTSFCHQ